MLIVGAFPPPNMHIYGGIVTSCRTLLSSSFADHFDLVLIDSTQISNPPPPVGVRGILAFRRFCKFCKILFSTNLDGVLLFTAVGFSVVEKGAMAWLARSKRIPIFLFPRGAGLIQTVQDSVFHRAWVYVAMRGSTHLLCQGPAWKRFAMDVLRLPDSRSPIVHNWTATEEMLAIGDSKVFTDNNKIPCILFLGWLEREKGIFELLDASLSLSRSHKFHLIIAGRGDAEEQARSFVQKKGLDDVIKFVGWVDGEAINATLERSDILVLPSWAEGFPNVIVEAMAAKLAVIVTSVGNIPDLLTDGVEALLVPPRDCNALEGAIGRLLVETDLRRRLAETGYSFARDNFSVAQGVARLSSVIDAAIMENVNRK